MALQKTSIGKLKRVVERIEDGELELLAFESGLVEPGLAVVHITLLRTRKGEPSRKKPRANPKVRELIFDDEIFGVKSFDDEL